MHDDSAAFRILLVEDDAPLASMVKDFLSQHEFDVSIEDNGTAAAARILQELPDAVILDINLPGMDGYGVCRAVRSKYSGAIVMLTARGDEIDEVVGLEVGADDYMSKPVRPRALLARLRAHLRRSTPAKQTDDPIRVGSLEVNPTSRSVYMNGIPAELTTAEFDLLYLLASHAGQTLSRSDIYQQIHEMPYDGVDRSIDLRISRLRKKLGDDPASPQRIKSVRGVGYMLSTES